MLYGRVVQGSNNIMVVQGSDNVGVSVAFLQNCSEEIRMNSVTLRMNSLLYPWVRRAIPVLGLSLLLLLVSVPAFSQGTARILGTVTDSSGAPIAGARVSITDIDIAATRTLTTDQAGEYNAPALRPGVKKIRAEYKGFKAIEREKVRLEVGQ